MKWIVGAMTVVAIGGVVSGCATLVLAPGAEQIKETRVEADVASRRSGVVWIGCEVTYPLNQTEE
jgi:hypothetical protein